MSERKDDCEKESKGERSVAFFYAEGGLVGAGGSLPHFRTTLEGSQKNESRRKKHFRNIPPTPGHKHSSADAMLAKNQSTSPVRCFTRSTPAGMWVKIDAYIRIPFPSNSGKILTSKCQDIAADFDGINEISWNLI